MPMSMPIITYLIRCKNTFMFNRVVSAILHAICYDSVYVMTVGVMSISVEAGGRRSLSERFIRFLLACAEC